MHGNYKENKETVSKHKIKSDNQRGIGYKAFAILAKYIINENMSVILVFTCLYIAKPRTPFVIMRLHL